MGVCNSKAADPNFHNINNGSIAPPLPASHRQKPSSPSLGPSQPGLASPAVLPTPLNTASTTLVTVLAPAPSPPSHKMPNPSNGSFDQKEQPSPTTRSAASASMILPTAVAQPMSSEAELNTQFESFMEEKCMKAEARAGMRKLPNTTKWMMLQAETQMKTVAAQKAANSQNAGGVNEESVHYYVNLLKDGKYSKKEAESLKISLRGAGKTWMKEYAEEGGVSLMLEAVGRGGRGVGGVVSELLGGIKTFMNNEYGLSVVVNTPQGIDCLIAALTSADDGQRMQLVDLLAVICWISDTGHELIVHSFQQRPQSYSVLVASLSSTNVELLTRVLTFINALINAVPLLEDRVSMRQQMVDLGLTARLTSISDVIDSHRGDRWDSVEKLSVQLELYGQVRDADSRETLIAGVDFSDVDAAFEYVKRSVVEDGHSSALIDLLHVLAVVDHGADQANKANVWDNIVYAVSVISQRLNERTDDDDPPTTSPLLTYEQLRTLLAEKEKSDVVARKDHMAELEVAVEQQRKAANEATMRLEHERDEWRVKDDEYRQTIREVKAKAEAADLDKVKRLQAEVDELKRQLAAAQQEAVAAAARVAAAPSSSAAAPDAPPMAPPMGDVPVPPTFGAPDAPPMAPPMAPDAPGAPPMAPPMAPGLDAPDAPPMAPPMAPSMGDAPDAPPMAPSMGGAPDAPPMAPGFGPPEPPGPPGAPPMAPGAPSFSATPSLPKKNNPKPAVPMKPFHWSTIPASECQSTLWKTHTDDKIHLDVDELQAQFNNNKPMPGVSVGGATDPQAAMAAAMAGGIGAKAHKKEVVELIDGKRSYQCNIALARFKMTHAAIRDALLAMDDKVLDDDKLASLQKIVPTTEEIEAVRDYDGKEDELGQTEQFFRCIASVPNVGVRVDLFLFKLRFDSVVDEIDGQLVLCERMVQLLRRDDKLHGLLQIVLKLGNYLNGGTSKGGAYGYKLDTLNKLKNTKSADGQYTLLHYLITLVDHSTEYKRLRAAIDELQPLQTAVRVESSVLVTEVNKVSAAHTKLKQQLTAVPQVAADRFHRIMNDFDAVLSVRATSLSERLAALTAEVRETGLWYGESEGVKMEELFTVFATFVSDWLDGERYIEQKKQQAEKEAKAKEDKERREREKMERNIASTLSASPSKAVNKDKLVDSVMEQLNGSSSEELMKAVKQRRRQAEDEAGGGGGGSGGGGFDPRQLTMKGKAGMVAAMLGRQSGGDAGKRLSFGGRVSGGQTGPQPMGFNTLRGK